MSTYRDYSELQRLLLQHPGVAEALIAAYYEHRSGNPSVINKHFRTLLESIGFAYHKQGHSPKELTYRIEHDDWGRHYCATCNGDVLQFGSVETGFSKHCSSKCAGQNPDTLAARKQTCMEKYGVENATNSDVARESLRKTCQARYGVDHYSMTAEFSEKFSAAAAARTDEQNDEINSKRKATNIETYGCEFPLQNKDVYRRSEITCRERYGVDHHSQCDAVRRKIEDTCMEKYGVPNSLLNAEVRGKYVITCQARYGVDNPSQRAGWTPAATNKSNRVYTFPSGSKVNVQGYEPHAISKLLSEGYTEEDIQLTNRPSVKYFWSSDDGFGDDKFHYYHPDIIIPKENRIIEVKSTWTYDRNGTDMSVLSKNLAKKKACIAAGYTFDFWVF